MARKVPTGLAAPVLFENLSASCPRLVGDLSRSQYCAFFVSEYSEVWNDGAAWVLCKTQSWDHRAEVHVYSFDHRFSNKHGFFKQVLRELRAAGKRRITTTLWEAAGHSVKRTLRELGFQVEGILRDYFQFELDGPFEDAELWAILLDENEGD